MSDQTKFLITYDGQPLPPRLTPEYLVSQEVLERRDDLMMDAESITAVTCKADDTLSAEKQGDIGRFVLTIEDLRKQAIRPFQDVIDKVNDAVKVFLAAPAQQKERLQALRKGFALAESKRIQEERAKADAEARKLAEENRKLEEAKRKAQAEGDAKAAAAMAEQQKQVQQKAVAVTQPAEKAPSTFINYRFVGLDEHEQFQSQLKLLAVHPELFDIRPRVRDIQAFIAKNPAMDLPGVEKFEDARVRGSKAKE